MPTDRKVHGIRGPIPSGTIVGRVDSGEGRAQLLDIRDLLAGIGLQTIITQVAAKVAQNAVDNADYLTDGGDPPTIMSNGGGTFMRTS